MQQSTNNVLYISDIHAPFTHKKALRFVSDLKKEYKCGTIIFGGDIFDSYSLSRYPKAPDSMTTRIEFDNAKKIIKDFVKEFPNAICLIGNHDVRITKKLREANIPQDLLFKTFNQLWELPTTWKWVSRYKRDGVTYIHGNKSGPYAHVNTARELRTSTVICHTHSTGGVQYLASYDDAIFGMNCGCLIDDSTYAFAYANDMASRPVLGAGVILNNGKCPIFIPMR